MLFADLLSLHLVTFLMFFVLVLIELPYVYSYRKQIHVITYTNNSPSIGSANLSGELSLSLRYNHAVFPFLPEMDPIQYYMNSVSCHCMSDYLDPTSRNIRSVVNSHKFKCMVI